MLVSYPCVLVAVGVGLPAWRVVSKPRQALRPSTGTGAGTCGSPGAFHSTPVAPGVLLCRLARSLPRVRYKILAAGFLVVRTV